MVGRVMEDIMRPIRKTTLNLVLCDDIQPSHCRWRITPVVCASKAALEQNFVPASSITRQPRAYAARDDTIICSCQTGRKQPWTQKKTLSEIKILYSFTAENLQNAT